MNSHYLIALGASLWGTTGVVARFIYDAGVSPFQLAILRSSIALVGLLPFVFRRFIDIRAIYHTLPALAVYGVTTVGIYSIAFFMALEFLPVSVALSLMAASSMLATLLSRIFYKEALTLYRVLALAAAAIGLPLVTGVIGGTPTGPLSIVGLGWAMTAALAYAMYTILGKSLVHNFEPKLTLAYNLFFGVLAMLVIDTLFIRSFTTMPPLTPSTLGWLAVIGLGCHLLGWLIFVTGLKGVAPARGALLLVLEPLVGTLLGWLVLRENLSVLQGVGAGIILIGLVFNSRSAAPEQEKLARAGSATEQPSPSIQHVGKRTP